MRTLMIAALALAAADEAELVRSLEAKGIKVKKTSAGVVTGVNMGVLKGITIEDYRAIGRCRDLITLNLLAEDLPFNDDAAAQLTGLDRLEKFFSNGAQLTDEGFKSLASWKSLKHLGFDHWFRTVKDRPIGAGLAHLAALPNLESVRLGGCQVGIEAMKALATIKTLKKLDLSHARWVDDDSLQLLQELPDLRILIASPQYSPRLTDATLRILSGVKSLEEITLSEIWLTYDSGFKHLAALPRLKKLSLPKVIASEEDLKKLNALLPNLVVEWTQPDEATSEKTKADYLRHFEKQKK